MFIIYCHTNSINGKCYVGQAKQGLLNRWRGHLWAARYRRDGVGCSALNAAIRKYGPDAFRHSALATATTQLEANRLETAWIARLKSLAPSGYNLDAGGGALAQKHRSTRRKLSANMIARLARMTPEERSAMAIRGSEARTPEERSESAERGKANMDPARRSEIARIARAAQLAKSTPAERSELSRRSWSKTTPEERSARAREREHRMTPKQRSAKALKGARTKGKAVHDAVCRKARAARWGAG